MRRQAFTPLMLLVGLLAIAWPSQLLAEEMTPNEIAAVQSAVRLQIDALAKDDAAGAFALATTDTRSRLKTADNFLRVIKEQYDPVYRHRLALFSIPKVVHGKVYQVVRLADFNSHVWLAIYLMHKDTDGTWKIDGCQLVETETVAV